MEKEKQENKGWNIHWDADEKAQYLWEQQKQKEAQDKKDKEEIYNSSMNYDPLNFFYPGE